MILVLLIALGAVVLVAVNDSGFIPAFAGRNIIAVSTGERIEFVATEYEGFGQKGGASLYWTGEDGKLEKKRSFSAMLRAVTGFDGKLLMVFQDGSTSIFKDAEWVRSVAAPKGFHILDVAALGHAAYAVALEDKKDIEHSLYRFLILDDAGWSPVGEPFDPGGKIAFGGIIDTLDGIAMLYAGRGAGSTGRLDLDNSTWYSILFQADAWTEPATIAIPAGTLPFIERINGKMGLYLHIRKGKVPGEIVEVNGSNLLTLSRVTLPDDGFLMGVWIVNVSDETSLILETNKGVWRIPLDDMQPGEPQNLLKASRSGGVRAQLYIGLLGILSILLVALGITWFVMRLNKPNVFNEPPR